MGAKHRGTSSREAEHRRSPSNESLSRHRTNPYLWIIPGAVYLLYVAIAGTLNNLGLTSLPISGWLIFLLPYGGMIGFHYSRRRGAKSAQQTLQEDHRPPVLYLRSFKDDRWRKRILLDESVTEFGFATYEESILQALEPLGPVVGLGSPHEHMPTLGAARDYVDNEAWHEHVRKFLRQSAYVVVVTNTTSGLSWEVAQLVKHVRPEKVLILVNRGKSKYRRFRTHYGAEFPKGLPDYRRGVFARTGGLAGVVWFGNDWEPHYERIRPNYLRSIKSPLKSRLQCALANIFERKGIAYSRPPITAAAAVVNIVMIFLVLMAVLAIAIIVADQWTMIKGAG